MIVSKLIRGFYSTLLIESISIQKRKINKNNRKTDSRYMDVCEGAIRTSSWKNGIFPHSNRAYVRHTYWIVRLDYHHVKSILIGLFYMSATFPKIKLGFFIIQMSSTHARIYEANKSDKSHFDALIYVSKTTKYHILHKLFHSGLY